MILGVLRAVFLTPNIHCIPGDPTIGSA